MNNENNNGFNLDNGSIPNNTGIESLDSTPNVEPNASVNVNAINNQNASVNTNGTFFNSSSLGSIDNSVNTNLDGNQNMGANLNTPSNTPNTLNNQVDNNVTPNYTNPQSINPQPMPGFENPNDIGKTPPISLEPEKEPKKKMNKTLFVVIIIVVLFIVGFGVYYVLQYTDLLNHSNTQVTVQTKDLEFNLGDNLPTDISEYATITGTDTKNCSIDMLSVDTTTAGTYSYTVSCGETKSTGQITIVDNGSESYEVKTVYASIDEEIAASSFIKGDTTGLSVSFVDETIVKNYLATAGSYEVTLKVVDASNRESTLTGKLVVLEYKIAGYYECEKVVPTTEEGMTISVKERFGLFASTFAYSGVTIEEYHFVLSSEESYADLKAEYQTKKTLTINNITSSEVVFDDTNKEITFTEYRDNDEVLNEYGSDNMKNYSSILTYFKDSDYTCKYVTTN